MTPQYYSENRSALAGKLPPRSLTLVYSGNPPHKTGDEYYSFFAERNFVYLTGIDEESLVLLIQKEESGEWSETLFVRPPDAMKERWSGRRIKADAAAQASGIMEIKTSFEFENLFGKLANSGRYDHLCLDLFKHTPDKPDDDAYRMVKYANDKFPWLKITSIRPMMKSLRLIKKTCEIEAIRRAEAITRDGVLAMMRASGPGMHEYQYKAEWDYALAQHGVISGFPPIISAGDNNFCIHYHEYSGKTRDGDMVLNDVGAVWDNMIVDVSRAWPCNGRFSERQKLLYNCAYNTSNYMFGIIKSGMPMNEVDAAVKRFNYEQLHEAGICNSFDEIGKLMWHGGAHHIGYDVHDQVSTIDEPSMPIRPGMVFCIDVGIYHEEWGIGFRLEDNCLVTEDGCENLSALIPRSIEEIEEIMSGKGA